MLPRALIMLGDFAVSDRGYLFMLFLCICCIILVLSQVRQIHFGCAKLLNIHTIFLIGYG